MGLFSWLFRPPRFDRIPDCYTSNREYLWLELKKAILFQQQLQQIVWIVSHFPDQFTCVQDLLAEAGIEYCIVQNQVDSIEIAELSKRNPGLVHLTLAELLVRSDRTDFAIDPGLALSMIAVERHPVLQRDIELERYAQSTPCRVTFGYYLSLQDPVIRPHLSENMLEFLSQFGMKESDLIHSLMVTKAINRALKRQAIEQPTDRFANSATEWLQDK